MALSFSVRGILVQIRTFFVVNSLRATRASVARIRPKPAVFLAVAVDVAKFFSAFSGAARRLPVPILRHVRPPSLSVCPRGPYQLASGILPGRVNPEADNSGDQRNPGKLRMPAKGKGSVHCSSSSNQSVSGNLYGSVHSGEQGIPCRRCHDWNLSVSNGVDAVHVIGHPIASSAKLGCVYIGSVSQVLNPSDILAPRY